MAITPHEPHAPACGPGDPGWTPQKWYVRGKWRFVCIKTEIQVPVRWWNDNWWKTWHPFSERRRWIRLTFGLMKSIGLKVWKPWGYPCAADSRDADWCCVILSRMYNACVCVRETLCWNPYWKSWAENFLPWSKWDLVEEFGRNTTMRIRFLVFHACTEIVHCATRSE